MVRLGSVVSRNSRGYYSCEMLDENGQLICYAVFSASGSNIQHCETFREAEALLTTLESTEPPEPAHP